MTPPAHGNASRCARRLARRVALALCLAGFATALGHATTLFTENFESGSGLSDGKWGALGYGQVTTTGYLSAHGLGFSAKGASGDLWSVAINVNPNTPYWAVVDYKETGAGGYFGYEEYTAVNGGGTDLGETWIWGDGAWTSISVFNTAGTAYHHYAQRFITGATTRSIKLKLEDWSGNVGPVGHVFFDNVIIQDVPPGTPALWQEVVK